MQNSTTKKNIKHTGANSKNRLKKEKTSRTGYIKGKGVKKIYT